MSNPGSGSHVKSRVWVTCQIQGLGHMSIRRVWVTCQFVGSGSHVNSSGLGHMSNPGSGSHVKSRVWVTCQTAPPLPPCHPAFPGSLSPCVVWGRNPTRLFVNNANSISCSCMLWNIVIYLQMSDVIRYLISSPNNGVSLTNKK